MLFFSFHLPLEFCIVALLFFFVLPSGHLIPCTFFVECSREESYRYKLIHTKLESSKLLCHDESFLVLFENKLLYESFWLCGYIKTL